MFWLLYLVLSNRRPYYCIWVAVVIKPLLFAIHGSSCPHQWRWAVSKKCKYSFQLLVPHRHKSVFSLLNGTYSAKIWKCPVNVKRNRTWSFATYQVLCDSKRLKVMTQTLCNSITFTVQWVHPFVVNLHTVNWNQKWNLKSQLICVIKHKNLELNLVEYSVFMK